MELVGPAGHWPLGAGQRGEPKSLDQQFVGGFPSGAGRVPVPHSALVLDLAEPPEAGRSYCTRAGTIPIGWDTGFCSRISLISAGTQNRALDLQRCNGRPQTCAGRNMHRSRRSMARKF